MKLEDYEQFGLSDIYLHSISFISNYVVQNYDPMEVFNVEEGSESDYAFAQRKMKEAAKAILDEIKKSKQIHLNTIDKTFDLSNMNIQYQNILEKEIDDALISYVNKCFEERKSIKK